ncbi:hypothetical protein ACFLZ7_02375 [Nanoarchaeota archaeon]
MALFRLETAVESYVLTGDKNVCVRGGDGSQINIMVKDAHHYVGKSHLALKRGKVRDATFEKVSTTLKKTKTGKFSKYGQSEQRMYVQTEEGGIPVLAHTLQSAAKGQNASKVLDGLYKIMTQYASRNSCNVVQRSQLDSWYEGNEIVPQDWGNFAAMASAKDEFPELVLFQQFYDDFVNLKRGVQCEIGENLRFDHRFYWNTRKKIGRMIESGFKHGTSNPKKKQKSTSMGMDMSEVDRDFYEHYFTDIDPIHFGSPLLSVTPLEQGKKKKKKLKDTFSPRVSDLTKTAVYISDSSEDEQSKVKTKPIDEIIRDFRILERSLFDQLSLIVPELCTKEEPPIDIDEGEKMPFIAYQVEDRMRKYDAEKGHLGLTHDERMQCVKTGNSFFERIFFTQEINKMLNHSVDAFQRFKEAHDLLRPAYPSDLHEYEDLVRNLYSLSMASKIGLVDSYSSDKRARHFAKLNRTKSRFDELKEKNKTLLVKHKKLNLSEHVSRYISKVDHGIIEDEDPYHTVIQKFARGDFDGKHYTEEEISSVLRNYGLEEFIGSDLSIHLLKHFKEESPNVSPLPPSIKINLEDKDLEEIAKEDLPPEVLDAIKDISQRRGLLLSNLGLDNIRVLRYRKE